MRGSYEVGLFADASGAISALQGTGERRIYRQTGEGKGSCS